MIGAGMVAVNSQTELGSSSDRYASYQPTVAIE